MLVKQQNGKTCTPDIPNVRGIRIDTITLDKADISTLCSMHQEDIVKFLLLLDTCMWVPPKSRRELLKELGELYRDLHTLNKTSVKEALIVKGKIAYVEGLVISSHT